MDLTKCFTDAAGGNWIGKCVLYHIAMYVLARGLRTVGESGAFMPPILKRQENREGRHLQFYYYFNGFLYHSGIALSNALGP